MSSTVLALVQEFAGLRGLPVPSALFGVTEKNGVHMRAVVNSVVRECLRYSWPQQKINYAWTASATEDQGALETLFPGYISFIPGTMWSTDRTIPVLGPVSDQEWAAGQSLGLLGPPFSSWLAGGHLYLSPAPNAAENFTVVYLTRYGYVSGTTPQETFSSNSDTVLFPDDVMLKGIEYVWRKQKGEAYVDDYNDFIGLIAKNKAQLGAPALSLESRSQNPRPGIVIPPGSWNL